MKTILFTGGAGFISSNLVEHLIQQHPDYQYINLDLLTYAGNLNNLKRDKTGANTAYNSLRLNFLSEFHAYLLSSVFNGKILSDFSATKS